MSQVVHVTYEMEQDEDGVWCASAALLPSAVAFGDGGTPEEALADLREGLLALVEEVGLPSELTLEVA